MNVLVLIKIVNRSTFVDTIQDSENRLSSGALEMNPADVYALEMALRIKDQCPDTTVTVMTMAPKDTEYYLKEAIAMGADQAVLISDRKFAGSDTLATAKVLFAAVSSLPRQDLILCGKKAIDSDTGHVGPQLAVMLGIPWATNVVSFEASRGSVSFVRSQEEGIVEYETAGPALLSLCAGNLTVRIPTIMDKRRARKADVKLLGSNELTAFYESLTDQVGIRNSRTKVSHVQTMEFRKGRGILTDDASRGMSEILDSMNETGPGCRITLRASDECCSGSVSVDTDRSPGSESAQHGGNVSAEERNLETDRCTDDESAQHGDRGLIWVLGENISPSFPGLIYRAKELAIIANFDVKVIPFVSGGHAGPDVSTLNGEAQAVKLLAGLWRKEKPNAILLESSVFSCSIAPALSAIIDAGLTADCTELFMTPEGVLMQSRPTYGNRKLATIVNNGGTAMATVRKGVFCLPGCAKPRSDELWENQSAELKENQNAGPRENGSAEFRKIRLPGLHEIQAIWDEMAEEREDFACHGFHLVRRTESGQKLNITDAEIILAGGLGLGSKENFNRLFELAEILDRTGKFGRVAVGATRAAVAAGYATYDHQVGQTGCSVSPKLYLAFGISGAVQHISGITGSEKIIAVNTDSRAAIHCYSDYSVTTDCNQMIEQLTAFLCK